MKALHEKRKTESSHWQKSRESAECAVFEYINSSTIMDELQRNLSVKLVEEYIDKYSDARGLQTQFHAKGFNYCGSPLFLMDVVTFVSAAAVEAESRRKQHRDACLHRTIHN